MNQLAKLVNYQSSTDRQATREPTRIPRTQTNSTNCMLKLETEEAGKSFTNISAMLLWSVPNAFAARLLHISAAEGSLSAEQLAKIAQVQRSW